MLDDKIINDFEESKNDKNFHPLNETKLFVFFERLIKKDEKLESKFMNEAALILKKLLLEGRQPSLNPCIDDLWTFDKDDVVIGLKKLIKERMKLTTEVVDNNMNYIRTSFSIDIVFGNLDPFIESKEIKIEKLEIQTPLYKHVIEG